MKCLLRIPSLLIHDALQVRDLPILDAAGNVPTIPVNICTKVATNDYGFIDADDLQYWSATHPLDGYMHADLLRKWLTDSLRLLQQPIPPTGHTPGTQRLHPYEQSACGVTGSCGSSARCEDICGHDVP